MLPATQSLAPPFHPTHGHFSSSCPLAPPLTLLPARPLTLAPTSSSSNPPTSSSRCRFAEPKTDEEVHRVRTLVVPKKTFEDTQYCFRLWEAWREHRNTTTAVQIGSNEQMSNSELQHWLNLFIQKVRKQDGSVFPPASLHHITAGSMRHLRWNGRP